MFFISIDFYLEKLLQEMNPELSSQVYGFISRYGYTFTSCLGIGIRLLHVLV